MYLASQISNPFPGLRAFEEDEDILFFGREKQTDELLTKLRTSRLIAVIGSSGSGKSSLVKSGLIPAIQSGFMSGRGSSWIICSFRPGNDPIGNLAKALVNPLFTESKEEADNMDTLVAMTESVLRRTTSGLSDAYKQSEVIGSNNLLILVDQFEEIFRFRKFENESKQVKKDSVTFINLLLAAAKQSALPIYIVFTMRADFLTDCTDFRGLPEAINDGSYLVPRMTREERREAIVGPISVANSKINQHLLNTLLNDVGDNPDQLPIMQHALMRTFEYWKQKNNQNSEIEIADFEAIGTMTSAISQHAEEAYGELKTDRDRRICEIIFKTLTDSTSDARGIRRPSRMSELCAITEASFEEVTAVIEIFRKQGRGFLMPPINTPLTLNTIIDISHESIMRVWERLINWLAEENQSSEMYVRLSEAADNYELGKGGLLRDPELQLAWRWKENQNPNEKWASRFDNNFDKTILYLNYSKDQQDLEIIKKEAAQKRRLQLTQRILVGTAIFSVIVIILAIFSWDAKQKATMQEKIAKDQTKIANENKILAEKSKDIAEKNKEAALSEKILADIAKEKAILSEQEALKQKDIALKNKQEALFAKSVAEIEKEKAIISQQKAINSEKEALKQKDIATENEQKAIQATKNSNKLRELAEARNLATKSILKFNENKISESIDLVEEAYKLNEKNNGPIQNRDIYNALTLNWSASIKNKNKNQLHKFPIRSIITKPNSNLVISGDESGLINISKSNEGVLKVFGTISVKNEIRSLCLSPNGKNLLVLTANEQAFVYGIEEENNKYPLVSTFKYDGIGKSAGYLNNNEIILLTSNGVERVNIENKVAKIIETVKSKFCTSLAIGKNTQKIYISEANNLKVYNFSQSLSQKPVQDYKLNSFISSIDLSENENILAAGTLDGSIWLKDIASTDKPINFTIHLSAVNDIKFGKQNGKSLQLASASSDNQIYLIDVNSKFSGNNNEDAISLIGHNLWVYKLCYAQNGKFLFSSSEDQQIIGWVPSMANLLENIKKNIKN
jgi:hypothetical protein